MESNTTVESKALDTTEDTTLPPLNTTPTTDDTSGDSDTTNE